MKICILGPVSTNKYWGGVSSFDEGIAEAFIEAGHEVVIISEQYNEIPIVNELPSKLLEKRKVLKTIKDYHPNVVIASLKYGRYFRGLKKHPDIRKIYFLHGFFNFASYGAFKTLLATCFQRWMCSLADEVVSNSYFTSALNYKFWGIKSDRVAWLGVDRKYREQVLENPRIKNANNGNILFAGRLAKGKGVDRIIKAFSLLNNQERKYKLNIAGDGPLKVELENLAYKNGINACFLGKIEHDQMYEYYRNAEIFISLNETESFGITYVEALLCGCKIICPKTGGQIEFLSNYPERVKFVDPYQEQEIKSSLNELLNIPVHDLESEKIADEFSYNQTVRKILDIRRV